MHVGKFAEVRKWISPEPNTHFPPIRCLARGKHPHSAHLGSRPNRTSLARTEHPDRPQGFGSLSTGRPSLEKPLRDNSCLPCGHFPWIFPGRRDLMWLLLLTRRGCSPGYEYNMELLLYMLGLSANSQEALSRGLWLYDKRGDFDFPVVNFPYLSSNIPESPAYGVFVWQLIRYARVCSKYEDFLFRGSILVSNYWSRDILHGNFRLLFGNSMVVIHLYV